jgi:hypothetical protein
MNARGNPIKSSKIVLSILSACVVAQPISSQTPGHGKRIVIAASAVLDGKGGALHDTRIVIEESKIVAIDPKAVPVDWNVGRRAHTLYCREAPPLMSAMRSRPQHTRPPALYLPGRYFFRPRRSSR